MKIELEHVLPADIERRSFAIISQELGPRTYGGPYEELILKRVIHTSADFDYSENLTFSPGAVEGAMEAIRQGGRHCDRHPNGPGGHQQDFFGPVRRPGALLHVRPGCGRRGEGPGNHPGGCLHGKGGGLEKARGSGGGKRPYRFGAPV